MKKKVCGIYMITNPKGLKYVGQSVDIDKRFADYKSLRLERQSKLHTSLKKYGADAHKFEVLEECAEDLLGNLEKQHLDKIAPELNNLALA